MGGSSLRDAAYVAYMQAERMRELRQRGYSNSQIAKKLNTTQYKVSKTIGPPPKGKRPVFHINVNGAAYQRVKDMAKEMGFVLRTGEGAGQGSVAHFLEAIANGVIHVTEYDDRQRDDERVHLSDFPREVTDPGSGDGQAGKIVEGSFAWEPGFLPLADEGATGDREAGTENLHPEHREALHDGGDQ